MEIKELLIKGGKVNSALIREDRFSNKFKDDYISIINHSENIGITNRSFPEKIYHWINSMYSPFYCKECHEKIPRFLGVSKGYAQYCSSKCSNGSKGVKDLKKDSYIKKYGVDNPSKSESVKQKIQETFNEKYGGNPFSLDLFKERIKNTCKIKYGSEYTLSIDSQLRKSIDEKNEKKFYEKYNDLKIVRYEIPKNGGCEILCDQCKNIFYISKWNLHQRRCAGSQICTICNPMGSDTDTAIEVFIRNILIKAEVNFIEKSRSILGNGKELDFFVEDLKIGIECNGIYWHSNKFKHREYHREKTNIGIAKGITIIQIMEDEIVFKPDIVKSRILSTLNKNKLKIAARKCEIEEIPILESNLFLENNHIQGSCGSSIRIGLYHEGNLVSVMTFGKRRKSLGANHKDGEYELIRFCNTLNTSVVGGASKMLSYFIKKYNPKKIISYCDRRWSPEGNLYKSIGFIFIKNTVPNYWYYKKNSIEKKHRFNFRKDVLVKEGYDPKKTESQIMEERGYLRVYDSGSSIWELNLPESLNH